MKRMIGGFFIVTSNHSSNNILWHYKVKLRFKVVVSMGL